MSPAPPGGREIRAEGLARRAGGLHRQGGKLVVKVRRKSKAKLKRMKRVKALLVLTTTAPGQKPVVTSKRVTLR